MRNRKGLFVLLLWTMLCSWFVLNFFIITLSNHKFIPTANAVILTKNMRQPLFKQEVRGPTQVLLLTYMRSGSSLVGDILQHMPDAFYVYEPLRMSEDDHEHNDTLVYVNGTIRYPPYNATEESVNILFNWFTCDISRLQQSSLEDEHFLSYGLKTRTFNECTKRASTSLKDIDACIMFLQRICEDSPIRVMKTIRVGFNQVTKLMDALPNLKIIHLVRDPRATIHSLFKLYEYNETQTESERYIETFCTKLEEDEREKKNLQRKYPGRIITAFYENIARNPVDASKELYDFCGGVFTDSAKQYIYNITMAGHADNCNICTVRSNSTEHVDTWKQLMPSDLINMVQTQCNFIMKRYDYDIYLRDLYM